MAVTMPMSCHTGFGRDLIDGARRTRRMRPAQPRGVQWPGESRIGPPWSMCGIMGGDRAPAASTSAPRSRGCRCIDAEARRLLRLKTRAIERRGRCRSPRAACLEAAEHATVPRSVRSGIASVRTLATGHSGSFPVHSRTCCRCFRGSEPRFRTEVPTSAGRRRLVNLRASRRAAGFENVASCDLALRRRRRRDVIAGGDPFRVDQVWRRSPEPNIGRYGAIPEIPCCTYQASDSR